MKKETKEFWCRVVIGALIGWIVGCTMLALIYLASGFLSLLFGGLL